MHRHIARPGLEERASRHAPRRRDSEGHPLVFTAAMRDVRPKPRPYDDSEFDARWRRERICSSATLASTPIMVAVPPPITAHRGPIVSATQPRIGEPIAVPPISTVM